MQKTTWILWITVNATENFYMYINYLSHDGDSDGLQGKIFVYWKLILYY